MPPEIADVCDVFSIVLGVPGKPVEPPSDDFVMGPPDAIFASDPSTPPPLEGAPPEAPALADAAATGAPAGWMQALAEAPAGQQAAASSSAAPPAGSMQALAQEVISEVQPAGGPGLPTLQQAVRGATWLRPDPRAALARMGHLPLVPQGWVGPEETEMADPLPRADRIRQPKRAGARSDLPQGYDAHPWVPTSGPLVDRTKLHHIGGPGGVAHAFEFPSSFQHNWLGPAPLNREITYSDVCQRHPANLCTDPYCKCEHQCA
eukprot:6275728-Alexandrium_andersonii.AAC.1